MKLLPAYPGMRDSSQCVPHATVVLLARIPSLYLHWSGGLLVWIAKRLPRWVNSDHLTVLGTAAMALAGFCYALARWTDHWGTRWEHKRGVVRIIRDDEMWEP